VDRFVALVHMAVGYYSAQRANDVCFCLKVHSQVRLVPIAKHTQPLEVFALLFDLLACIFAASHSKSSRRHLTSRFTDSLLYLKFDWQSMAVPARHIRRIASVKRSTFYDKVFDDLINRMTNMDLPVGVGRAIVKNEFWLAAPRFTNFLV